MKNIIFIFLIYFNFISCFDPEYLNVKNDEIEKIFNSLSLREKIAQLFFIAAASDSKKQIEKLSSLNHKLNYNFEIDYIEKMIELGVGGLIFFSGNFADQIKLTNKFQVLSKVPLLIGMDAEWGLHMRLGEDKENNILLFPRNMTLAAIKDKKLIYDLGLEIGKELKKIGVDINFAPVIDINKNSENVVIGDRAFSDDKEIVTENALLFSKGLRDAGILDCVKHFPGHGDTNVDSHFGLPEISHNKERLYSVELYPFNKLINNGTSAVMMAHIVFPNLNNDEKKTISSLSKNIINNILKIDLNFKGLIITDALGMGAITDIYKNPGEAEYEAFKAGNDVLLCPLNIEKGIDLIENSIKNGTILEERLNESVIKILKAKSYINKNKKIEDIECVRSFLIRKEAIELQEKLFEQSITFIKNGKEEDIFYDQNLKNKLIVQIGSPIRKDFLDNFNCGEKLALDNNFNNESIDEFFNSIKFNKIDNVLINIFDLNRFKNKKYGISENISYLIDRLKKENKNVEIAIYGTPYSLEFLKKEKVDSFIIFYENNLLTNNSAIKFFNGKIIANGKLPINIFNN